MDSMTALSAYLRASEIFYSIQHRPRQPEARCWVCPQTRCPRRALCDIYVGQNLLEIGTINISAAHVAHSGRVDESQCPVIQFEHVRPWRLGARTSIIVVFVEITARHYDHWLAGLPVGQCEFCRNEMGKFALLCLFKRAKFKVVRNRIDACCLAHTSFAQQQHVVHREMVGGGAGCNH